MLLLCYTSKTSANREQSQNERRSKNYRLILISRHELTDVRIFFFCLLCWFFVIVVFCWVFVLFCFVRFRCCFCFCFCFFPLYFLELCFLIVNHCIFIVSCWCHLLWCIVHCLLCNLLMFAFFNSLVMRIDLKCFQTNHVMLSLLSLFSTLLLVPNGFLQIGSSKVEEFCFDRIFRKTAVKSRRSETKWMDWSDVPV